MKQKQKSKKQSDKLYVYIYPQTKPWKQRLAIIFHVLFGLTYYHWVTRKNVEKLLK